MSVAYKKLSNLFLVIPLATPLEISTAYTPFQVSLHYTYNDDFICGGSIISSKVVITSAHCMYYRWGGIVPPIIVYIAFGKTRLNESAWKTFGVANITLHPLFNKTNLENDLALIEIEETFEADRLAGPIDVEKYVAEFGYQNCILPGWNQDTNEFQVMEVILIECTNYPNHICTNKKNQDNTVCINNAGNPLVCDGKLIGVLSVEPNCEDPDQLAIFEDIRYSMSWLKDIVKISSSNTTKNNTELTYYLTLLYLTYFYFKNFVEI